MKKSSLILAVFFLIAMSFVFQRAEAQEKSKEEKEKEKEMQEAIDAQKKAMIEQKKVQEEVQKALQQSQEEVQKAMEHLKIRVENPVNREDLFKIYEDMGRRGSRNFSTGEPFIFNPSVQFYGQMGDNSERTSWEFTKNIKESSFSRDYTFDVENSVKTVVMSVNGDCKDGEIRIRILMPNGKPYSDIVIDEFGNLNWRKSFSISETENMDKTGAWKFEIKASKASGYFRISLQTY